AKSQPRGKFADVGEGGEVGADFCQQPLCRQRVNAGHLSEVDPESAVEILPQADQLASPRGFSWVTSGRNWPLGGIDLGRQRGQQLLDFRAHLRDQLLVMPVSDEGLAKGEEMFATVV